MLSSSVFIAFHYGILKSFRINTYAKNRGRVAASLIRHFIVSILVLLCIIFPTASARAQAEGEFSDQGEVHLSNAKSLFHQGKFSEVNRDVIHYVNISLLFAEDHFLLVSFIICNIYF